jgi:arylamine N-acetyltransferase
VNNLAPEYQGFVGSLASKWVIDSVFNGVSAHHFPITEVWSGRRFSRAKQRANRHPYANFGQRSERWHVRKEHGETWRGGLTDRREESQYADASPAMCWARHQLNCLLRIPNAHDSIDSKAVFRPADLVGWDKAKSEKCPSAE